MHNRWLVLFDIDGTLLHSAGCGRAATELALQATLGTNGALDSVNFAGKTDWGILLEALAPAGLSHEAVRAYLPRHDQAMAHHLAAIIAEYPVMACPGALEVLTALQANDNVVLGLVTGNMPGAVPVKLNQAGIDPAVFQLGAYGSEGWERAMLPPLALQRAQKLCGCEFSPERIIIIGDTPDDITCAASIKARTLAVATGPFTIDQLRVHNPTYVFESMADVDMVIDAILNHHTS